MYYHIYLSLELGEPNVKQYIAPSIDEILSNKIKHEKLDIWIPSHEHQLVKKIEKNIRYLELSCLKLQEYGFKGIVIDSSLPINYNLII